MKFPLNESLRLRLAARIAVATMMLLVTGAGPIASTSIETVTRTQFSIGTSASKAAVSELGDRDVTPPRASDAANGVQRPELTEGSGKAATLTSNVSTTAQLIAAINNSNAAGAGPHTIILADTTFDVSTVDNYWYGPTGLPAITSEITIRNDGAGATIRRATGAPNFRLFYVSGGNTSVGPAGAGTLTLMNVTITNGFARGGNGGAFTGGGGGLGAGGAIYNQGTLNLYHVLLTNNTAQGGDGGSDDGVANESAGGGGMGGNGGNATAGGGVFSRAAGGGGMGGAGGALSGTSTGGSGGGGLSSAAGGSPTSTTTGGLGSGGGGNGGNGGAGGAAGGLGGGGGGNGANSVVAGGPGGIGGGAGGGNTNSIGGFGGGGGNCVAISRGGFGAGSGAAGGLGGGLMISMTRA